MNPRLAFRLLSIALAVSTPALAQTAADYVKSANEKVQKIQIGPAIEDMDRAIRLEPTNPELYIKRGDIKAITVRVFAPLSNDKDDKGSLADFNEAIRLAPNSVSGYLARAGVKRALADYAGAIADYEQVMRIRPDSHLGYSFRGWTRLDTKDTDGAMADFDRAIAAPDGDASSRGWQHHGRSLAWAAKGDRNRSLADLDQAITLSQGDQYSLPTMLLDRAHLRGVMGNPDGVLADLDSYLALKPNDDNIFVKRGQTKRARGDTGGALADFEKAIALDEDHDEARYERGLIRLSQEKWTAAVEDFEVYLDSAISPDDYLAFYFYIADKRLGRADAVSELTESMADWRSDSWVHAIGSFLLGKLPEAELLTKAAQGAPNGGKGRLTDAHYYIGMAKLLAGNTAGARASFEQSVAQGSGLAYHEHFLAQAELARLGPR